MVAIVADRPLGASETSREAEDAGASTALAQACIITLSLDEGGESSEFSMTVATTDVFSMNVGDKNIAFRGRIRPLADGKDVVEFTLEFSRVVEEGGPPRRRGSTWKGSAPFSEGREIEIATFLGGSFSLRFDALD
jgi:hypothetical protein